MKTGADNIRNSAIQGIIERIKNKNIDVIIYEPSISADTFSDCIIVNSLEIFKNSADVILTNRFSEELSDVKGRVITRDLSGTD
jgi:UDPglucose 6-dehydrogenase